MRIEVVQSILDRAQGFQVQLPFQHLKRYHKQGQSSSQPLSAILREIFKQGKILKQGNTSSSMPANRVSATLRLRRVGSTPSTV